jgi:predicted nucleic acid-binding protein
VAKRIVVDASIAAGWLLPDEAASLDLMTQLDVYQAFVPSIFRVEVCNLLNMAVKRQRISLSAAIEQMELLSQLQIQTFADFSAETVLNVAARNQLTAYDATYLVLALEMRAILGSRDKKLLAAARAEGLETTTG